MCDYLYQNIQPFGNIFKDEFCQVINNPPMLTEIRVAIQKLMEADMMAKNIPEQPSMTEQQPEEDNEEEGAEF